MTDDFIFDLMKKFNDSSIVDFEFTRDGSKIVLKKKEGCVEKEIYTSVPGVQGGQPLVSGGADGFSSKGSTASVPTESKKDKKESKSESKLSGDVIKSPIVGTFYRSPSPDSPAYVQKGAKIKKGDPICIIEAMKMMNTFNAEYDFEVLDILVKNGDLVEFDQPLFSVKKL